MSGRGARLREAAGWSLLVGIAALVVGSPKLAPERNNGEHWAAGYNGLIDRLAQARLLAIEPVPATLGAPGRERVIIDTARVDALAEASPVQREACTGRGGIFGWPRAAGGCGDLIEQLRRRTFLGVDMLSATPGTWRRDGRRLLGLTSTAHVPPPLRQAVSRWTGRVTYRGGGDHARLMLADLVRAGGDIEFGGERKCALGSAGAAGCTGRAVSAIVLQAGEEDAGSIDRLGNRLVLTLRSDAADRVAIDGRRLGTEDDIDGAVIRLLAPGQILALGLPEGGPGRVFQVVESPGAASEPSAGGRLDDPGLAAALAPLARAAPEGDIESTLAFALQRALQRELEEVSLQGVASGIPVRAGAVLMDGLSGEIVALGTFPADRAHLTPAQRNSGVGLEDLQQHFALTPMAVGSTAKVPFAAAIADRFPELLAMHTDCEPGRFAAIADQPLRNAAGEPVTLADNCRGERTRFRDFIAFSSNRFALAIMEYARRKTPGDGPDWRDTLRTHACMAPVSADGAGDPRPAGCRAPLWQTANGTALAAGDSALPGAELRLDRVHNLYVDYYQSILGGNRAYMPLAGLAQAYARIIGGRDVAPRLSVAGALTSDARLPLNEEVWRQLLDGMWGTIARDGGTARNALAPARVRLPAMRQGWYLLAKTGTPTVERIDPAGQVQRGDGSALVLAAIRTRTGRPPRSPSDLCALRIVAVNAQFRLPGRPPPAAEVVNALAQDSPEFRRWLAAPCPEGRSGK